MTVRRTPTAPGRVRFTRVGRAAVPVVTLLGAGLIAATPSVAATSAPDPASMVVAGGTASTHTATEPSLLTPGAPAALQGQQLDWQECFPGAGFPQLECTGVEVPKDWAKPDGERLTLAVSRVKASDPAKRRGVLFTNPGGPGGPGLTLSLYISLVEPEVAKAYDVIGIDPRGVGSSQPVLECADPAILTTLYNLDGRDVSKANQQKFRELNEQYASACASDPLTPVIRTAQVVRDFDLVRAVLREHTISYVGYSAGTWLGTWYAAVFPKRVDRFLLDGNLDWTSNGYSSAVRQPRGFQDSFELFLQPWIAKYASSYGLGTTAKQVNAVYEARRAALAKTPLTLADGSTLTASGYDSGIAGGLYWTGLYDGLATAMSVIERYATATAAERQLVVDVFGSSGALGYDPFWAVSCQDDQGPSYREVVRDTDRFRRTDPLIGANWNVYPCSFWPGHPKGSPVEGEELPKLLMLNNDYDPATPLANAEAARRHTPKARLVTVKRQPDHTIYGNGAPCVESIANRWLLAGALPAKDTTCPGLPLPVPAAASAAAAAADTAAGSAAATAAAARAGVPAKVWTDRFVRQHGAARIG